MEKFSKELAEGIKKHFIKRRAEIALNNAIKGLIRMTDLTDSQIAEKMEVPLELVQANRQELKRKKTINRQKK